MVDGFWGAQRGGTWGEDVVQSSLGWLSGSGGDFSVAPPTKKISVHCVFSADFLRPEGWQDQRVEL